MQQDIRMSRCLLDVFFYNFDTIQKVHCCIEIFIMVHSTKNRCLWQVQTIIAILCKALPLNLTQETWEINMVPLRQYFRLANLLPPGNLERLWCERNLGFYKLNWDFFKRMKEIFFFLLPHQNMKKNLCTYLLGCLTKPWPFSHKIIAFKL